MKKKTLLKIIFALAAAAFILSSIKLGGRIVMNKKKAENDAKISELYHPEEAEPEQASAKKAAVIQATELSSEKSDAGNYDPPVVQNDFLQLKSTNEHVIGWLKVADQVDDPVVWYDNSFYLTHDFYGNEDPNGTLFVNEMNSVWPADDVILIHGHNMRNGEMFGNLLKYQEYDYLAEYPLIDFRTIYDTEKAVYYVPVSAFNASMEKSNPEYFDVLQLNFENEDEGKTVNKKTERQSRAFEEYLASVRELSLWDSPVDVNADDSLLMLVTCSYEQDDGRFMLICRKLRPDETPESIKAIFKEETGENK